MKTDLTAPAATNPLAAVRRLHEHRAWANGVLLASARGLTDEQLRKPFPIGQGSVWATLLHLYAAEYVWLAALCGDETPLTPGDLPGELPGNQKGEDALSSLAELEREWAALDGRWKTYLTNVTEIQVEQSVKKRSTSSGRGKAFETPALDVLLHVCTHAQYTTAQAVHMLHRLGVEPLPDVMLITLSRGQL